MNNNFDATKIANQLKQDLVERNITTISEFAEFRPLFDQSIRINGVVNREELSELFDRYRFKFSMLHPIVIVTDDRSKVIEVRPPAQIQFPLFNQVLNKPDVLIDSYSNIMENPDQPAHKKAAISGSLKQAFTVVQGSKKFRDKRELAENIEKKRNPNKTNNHTLAENKDKTEKARKATKDMEWE